MRSLPLIGLTKGYINQVQGLNTSHQAGTLGQVCTMKVMEAMAGFMSQPVIVHRIRLRGLKIISAYLGCFERVEKVNRQRHSRI